MKCFVCDKERPKFLFKLKIKIGEQICLCKVCEDCERTVYPINKKCIDNLLDNDAVIWEMPKTFGYIQNYVKYGLTFEDYNELRERQKNRCKICGKHQLYIKKLLSIDHCHRTGVVRGLLCLNCNVGVGMLKDNTTTILKSLIYVAERRENKNILKKLKEIEKEMEIEKNKSAT